MLKVDKHPDLHHKGPAFVFSRVQGQLPFGSWPLSFVGCPGNSFARPKQQHPNQNMEEGGDYFSGINNTVVLGIAGGVAATFLFILLFDSYRRKRNRRRGMGRHARHSGINPISRWYRHTRHFLRLVKETYQLHKQAKVTRERSRTRTR
jgi:hypothetical protein